LIIIKNERCTGCGACLDICPNSALYLLEGKAVVDEALCCECEACVSACPEQAILITESVPSRVPAVRPEPETILVRTEPAPVPVPLRSRVLPVVGAALAWAGREMVPYLADIVLDRLDRSEFGQRRTGATQSRTGTGSRGRKSGGRRHRRRRRGA
jgi:NAD-dependent dihydropyrimidine dehydrogenase PreA subunit